jgi:hypothetical protein
MFNPRPSNNKVLVFKEMNDTRRSIEVFSTEDPTLFKVVYGLNARNQCVNIRHNVDIEEIKRIWIDNVVNGYSCVINELFPRGILDCMNEPSTKKLIITDIEETIEAEIIEA